MDGRTRFKMYRYLLLYIASRVIPLTMSIVIKRISKLLWKLIFVEFVLFPVVFLYWFHFLYELLLLEGVFGQCKDLLDFL